MITDIHVILLDPPPFHPTARRARNFCSMSSCSAGRTFGRPGWHRAHHVVAEMWCRNASTITEYSSLCNSWKHHVTFYSSMIEQTVNLCNGRSLGVTRPSPTQGTCPERKKKGSTMLNPPHPNSEKSFETSQWRQQHLLLVFDKVLRTVNFGITKSSINCMLPKTCAKMYQPAMSYCSFL